MLQIVLDEYENRKIDFLFDVFNSTKYLEDLTGISTLAVCDSEVRMHSLWFRFIYTYPLINCLYEQNLHYKVPKIVFFFQIIECEDSDFEMSDWKQWISWNDVLKTKSPPEVSVNLSSILQRKKTIYQCCLKPNWYSTFLKS